MVCSFKVELEGRTKAERLPGLLGEKVVVLLMLLKGGEKRGRPACRAKIRVIELVKSRFPCI